MHFLVAKLQILNSSLQEGQVWIFSIIIDYYQTQSISRIERNFRLIIDYNWSSIQHYELATGTRVHNLQKLTAPSWGELQYFDLH